jgi:hypothetical protein
MSEKKVAASTSTFVSSLIFPAKSRNIFQKAFIYQFQGRMLVGSAKVT